MALDIKSVCSHYPKQFWDQVKKLGPQRKSKFQTEFYNIEGDVTSDTGTLKNA
jgi:hypothetical protein